MPTVCTATTAAEIARCYPVMAQLRPNIAPDEFPERIAAQFKTGYRLVYLMDGDEIVAVAGYRFGDNLAKGRYLYVDDLVNDQAHRSKGFGRSLLAWLLKECKANNCASLELTSGVQRRKAHRFYEREGMERSSYHYRIRV